eukprot:scaffold4223_cov189-Amphora_coffeaeformis.AAC.2
MNSRTRSGRERGWGGVRTVAKSFVVDDDKNCGYSSLLKSTATQQRKEDYDVIAVPGDRPFGRVKYLPYTIL